MEISTYRSGDRDEIKQLFTKVFSDSEGQSEGQSEGLLIGALVSDLFATTDDNDLYGFVVVDDKKIIGSILFSRLTFENGINAFLLSPVAISTDFQGQGIGQKLINFGLNTLKNNGVELAITYGDPNYYTKVGFRPITENLAKAPLKLSYPEGWLGQALVGNVIAPIAGNSKCVEAFNKPDIW